MQRRLLGGDSVDRLCKARYPARSVVAVQDVLCDGFIEQYRYLAKVFCCLFAIAADGGVVYLPGSGLQGRFTGLVPLLFLLALSVSFNCRAVVSQFFTSSWLSKRDMISF